MGSAPSSVATMRRSTLDHNPVILCLTAIAQTPGWATSQRICYYLPVKRAALISVAFLVCRPFPLVQLEVDDHAGAATILSRLAPNGPSMSLDDLTAKIEADSRAAHALRVH